MKERTPRRDRPANTAFAKRLTALMSEHAMGVRAAARAAGVPPSTVVSWRAGASPEDFVAVKRLAVTLGTTLSYLLTGEDDARPSGVTPTASECFEDGGCVFDGYARIKIERLIPKWQKGETKK